MNKDIENINFWEHGIDIKSRRIVLWSDLEENTVSDVIKGILFLRETGSKSPIKLTISSLGGDLLEMLGLYDIIVADSSCPVFTYATGKCMSAAPLLVAAGQPGYRYATPNCIFMVHDFSQESTESTLDQMKHELKTLKLLKQNWANLMSKHTKMDHKFWLRLASRKHDFYFSATEAIEYGIIDKIC